MRTYLLGASFVTALVCFPVGASAQCCSDHSSLTTTTPPAVDCCRSNDGAVAAAGLSLAEKPTVQELTIAFRDPVKVGEAILMGRYVIQHDDARSARGEPCTHIYEAADQRLPVVRFHCTHLVRAEAVRHTVVLRRTPDITIKALAEFQFAGETASHGVPTHVH